MRLYLINPSNPLVSSMDGGRLNQYDHMNRGLLNQAVRINVS